LMRERTVLQARWLCGMTLDETGRIMNLCRERVRQIEIRALRKLKRLLELQRKYPATIRPR